MRWLLALLLCVASTAAAAVPLPKPNPARVSCKPSTHDEWAVLTRVVTEQGNKPSAVVLAGRSARDLADAISTITGRKIWEPSLVLIFSKEDGTRLFLFSRPDCDSVPIELPEAGLRALSAYWNSFV